MLEDQGYMRVTVGKPVGDPRKNTINVVIEYPTSTTTTIPDPVPGAWEQLARFTAGAVVDANNPDIFNTGYDVIFGTVGTKLSDDGPYFGDTFLNTANTLRIFPGTVPTFNLIYRSGFGVSTHFPKAEIPKVRVIFELWETTALQFDREADNYVTDTAQAGETWFSWDAGTVTENPKLFAGYDYRVERWVPPPGPEVTVKHGRTEVEVVRAKKYRCRWLVD